MTQTPLSAPIISRFSSDVASLTEEVFGAEATSVLDALSNPVRTYYVRCNTLRISPEKLRDRLVGRNFKVSQHPIIKEALGIQIDGPFEIPSVDSKIVVDKYTAESVLQGANVYAPGIMKCAFIHPGDDATIVSQLGDVLGTGTVVMSVNDILTFRKGLAVRVQNRRYRAPQIRDLQEFSEGLLYPQSLAAMVTSHVLDPQQGETILDMNCAPGGKLSHISQLMHTSGKILGLDRNVDKITTTRRTVADLGCTNVTVSIHDSRYVHVDFPNLNPDRVIIDPPCSALGLRPKIYDHTSRSRVNDLAEYQKQFVLAGSKAVKRGGVVVYSVCTFTTQECEMIVEFAEEECGLKVVAQKTFLGYKGLQDIRDSAALCQRFHPSKDEIGYFIAKFERK